MTSVPLPKFTDERQYRAALHSLAAQVAREHFPNTNPKAVLSGVFLASRAQGDEGELALIDIQRHVRPSLRPWFPGVKPKEIAREDDESLRDRIAGTMRKVS